jgi:hypothetical protein
MELFCCDPTVVSTEIWRQILAAPFPASLCALISLTNPETQCSGDTAQFLFSAFAEKSVLNHFLPTLKRWTAKLIRLSNIAHL